MPITPLTVTVEPVIVIEEIIMSEKSLSQSFTRHGSTFERIFACSGFAVIASTLICERFVLVYVVSDRV